MNKISENKDNIKYLGILGNKTNTSENEEVISKEEVEEFTKTHEGNYLQIDDINDISNLKDTIKNAIEN